MYSYIARYKEGALKLVVSPPTHPGLASLLPSRFLISLSCTDFEQLALEVPVAQDDLVSEASSVMEPQVIGTICLVYSCK